MNFIQRACCLAYMVIALVACASSPPQNRSFENPGQDLEKLDTDLDRARAQGVGELAPQWFAQAEKARDEAKQALAGGQPLDTTGRHLARARQSLENAWATAQISGPISEQCQAARQKALKAGAEKLGAAFVSVEEQYEKLNRSVENQNVVYLRRNGPKVCQAYQDLEIRAIQGRYLGSLREVMADAERAGAPDRVPILFGKARAAMSDTENFISRDPYNSEAIGKKVKETTFLVRRMAAVSQSAVMFASMTPEETALYLEGIVARISRPLGLSDLRGIPVEEQVVKTAESAASLSKAVEKLSGADNRARLRIAHLEKRLYALTAKQEEIIEKRLAARASDRMILKMKGVFGPDEADVYAQGRQIVIRLRDIGFPRGEATLAPEHLGLLDKVQDVIKDFDDPRVTIEGYTDNGGTDQMDQLLSQMRAIAVKAYLVGKKTLPPDKIETIGYNASLGGAKAATAIQVWINPIDLEKKSGE